MSLGLYTLHTNDCKSTNRGIMYIKYSNDTLIMDSTKSLGQLQAEMDIYAEWCRKNCRDLNISKTKELVVDFHKRTFQHPHSVSNLPTDKVISCRYLGIIIDHRLSFQ